MKCKKCHAELPDNAKFCPNCGAKLEDSQKRRTPKSRGNGAGTAIKDGKSWVAIWTVETFCDDENKTIRQKRKWKRGFKTKSAALAYAANPSSEAPISPTLRSYWQSYENSDFKDLSDSKKSAMKIAWKKLEALASITMNEITIDALQSCVDSKAPTYYPAKDMKTLLSHLFKRAVAEGTARTNLAEFIRLPTLEETEAQPFTEVELHKFWKAYSDGDTFFGFILLMIYTGMMPGELLKLTPDMINWDTQEIIGCGLKTKKRKAIPIVFPNVIVPVLETLVKNKNPKSKYLIGIARDRFYDKYHAKLKAIGVRDLPPYSCRHTTATALAVGSKIAPNVIKEVMRHSNISTTQRYIHPDTADALAAVNSISS